MPTEFRTKKAAVNIAHQLNTQPILAFNQEGKIDVFLFDNTDAEVDKLGLDKSQQIPLSMLANANILFHVSQILRLEPGLTSSNDEQIISFLKTKFSDNILNPEIALQEIIDSWNIIASLPIAQRYAEFNPSKEKTRLGYHGAYELMLHDYIAKYLATLSRFERIETWVFVQASELLKSTLEGKSFSTNPYVKMDNLIKTTEECKQDIPDSAVVIDNIKARLEREQGSWYTTLVGMINFEMETLLEEESLKPKYQEIKLALQNLLTGKYEKVTSDEEIMSYLDLIIRQLKSASAQGRQAIDFLISKKLKEYNFTVDKKRPHASLVELAGNSSEEEETLLEKLLNPTVTFTPAMLTSIQRRARNEVVRDIVAGKLDAHAEKEKSKANQSGRL